MVAVTREIDTFESDEQRRSRTTSDQSKYTVDNFHSTTHGDGYRGESSGLSSFDFGSYTGNLIVFLKVSGQARIGYGRI